MRREGEPPLVTIRDVAARSGVSPSTVSRVLNNTVVVAPAKRAAVLRAVEALGFRPNVIAQELASGRSHAIGVLPQGIANPFFTRLLKGIEQGLRGSGYYPIVASGEHQADEARALELLLSHRVDGLILLGGHLEDAEIVRIAEKVPVVAVCRAVRGLEDRCVRVANLEGAYKATRHLLGLGHKRIVHITGLPWHPDAVARREGYEKAMLEAGITPEPKLIVEGDFEEYSGMVATQKLLAARTSFSAIFAANDLMAFGAGLALFRHGLRIPADVSLVGFDDQPDSAYTWPPLTTIRQPTTEMGVAAAKALVDELLGRGFILPSFNTDLVLRDSTAPRARRR